MTHLVGTFFGKDIPSDKITTISELDSRMKDEKYAKSLIYLLQNQPKALDLTIQVSADMIEYFVNNDIEITIILPSKPIFYKKILSEYDECVDIDTENPYPIHIKTTHPSNHSIPDKIWKLLEGYKKSEEEYYKKYTGGGYGEYYDKIKSIITKYKLDKSSKVSIAYTDSPCQFLYYHKNFNN